MARSCRRGRAGMRRDIPAALERVSERLPAMVIETLREQWARVAELDKEIGVIERRIKLWHRSNAASRKIAEIPGVGVLSATAVVAAMGDPAAFQVRPRVCCLARSRAAPQRNRGAGSHARYLQAREQVPPHPADPRCPRGAHPAARRRPNGRCDWPSGDRRTWSLSR